MTNSLLDCTQLDDEALIRLILRSNEAALSELYTRYGRLIFSVAFHIVGHQATAEEITLDVFTRVWEKADTYRPDRARVSTWLTSVARYRAIDVLRREGARAEKDSVSWAELHGEPSSNADGPETAVALTMQKRRVRTALAELPAEQLEVLALAYFRGYSHSQIADRLGHPLGTVKTRIRLAMQKLRRLLSDEAEI